MSPRTHAGRKARRARPAKSPTPALGRPAAPERVPTTPLIAAGSFGARLPAPAVARAIARGLHSRGSAAEECPIADAALGAGGLLAQLDELDFDARLRGARAVIVAERRLQERALEESIAFEIATRARQSGVPAYAVCAENGLDSFDARMLDLQLILVASSEPELTASGRKLAPLM